MLTIWTLIKESLAALIAIPAKLDEIATAARALVDAWSCKAPGAPRKPRRGGSRSRIEEMPEWARILEAIKRGENEHSEKLGPASYELVSRRVKHPARVFCEALKRWVISAGLPYTIGYINGEDRGTIIAKRNA